MVSCRKICSEKLQLSTITFSIDLKDGVLSWTKLQIMVIKKLNYILPVRFGGTA